MKKATETEVLKELNLILAIQDAILNLEGHRSFELFRAALNQARICISDLNEDYKREE